MYYDHPRYHYPNNGITYTTITSLTTSTGSISFSTAGFGKYCKGMS
jgi:hypothetical protein